MTERLSILFRCDGSPEIGFGHVVRCLALADELRDFYNCKVAFAMIEGTAGCSMAEAKDYQVLAADRDTLAKDYAGWLNASMDEVRAEAMVMDIRDELPIHSLWALKEKGTLIATIDDPSERRLLADLAFYPPSPQIRRMNWAGFCGDLHMGWDWVILRREFSHPLKREAHEHPVVLVTMGGSDPFGLTLKAITALDLLDDDFQSLVLLGPGFLHQQALNDQVSKAHREFHLLSGVKDIPNLMAQADLALGSFGVTAYELAAMGVPGIYMCLTEDHAESASVFVEAGMGECVGLHDRVSAEILSLDFSRLIRNRARWGEMSRACTKNVDGRGARRVADIIAGRIKNGN
jgi:spore coat polysaccharide biosynthesis predicted glycosyltransferase SpsG